MSVIRREIHGPDNAIERSGAQTYRPVRSGLETFKDVLTSRASGLAIAAAAGVVAAEPATLTAVVPLALAYGATLLLRPVTLPLRLPMSSRRKDHNHPLPGSRKPRMAAGIIFLGNCHLTGEEVWISNLDGRQHLSIPGVTGAGKTAAILGLLSNALAFGSGFVFVDGKGDSDLYAQVYALARRFGREKDIRSLNFLVASGDRDSATFNPFAWASADAIREMLMSQIEHNPAGASGGDNRIFMQRAGALLGALAPILVWMRDHHRVPIDIDAIWFATELQNVADLAFDRRFRVYDRQTGNAGTIDVPDMPEPLVAPLRSYLGETGGYDREIHTKKRQSDEPAKQHSFVKMHFSATFTQLAVSLGHIFRCQISDIDMRDVVLNRRILIVNLPALENSGETTTALGKLVVAALRNMMAQTLGGRLEGDFAEIIENKATTSPTPFPIALDELAAYVPGGATTLLQQGRGLGTMFILGWHDVAGLRARIGDAAFTLLNNANTQIIMRQNEGGENRRHLESTIGDTDVTKVTSYQPGDTGYFASRQAEVRQTSRMDWRDARGQIEGEGIIVHANVRVYATLFHADVKGKGGDAIRLNRPLAVPPPSPDMARWQAGRTKDIWEKLDAWQIESHPPPALPTLRALLEGFSAALALGYDPAVAADAAINAAGAAPDDPPAAVPALPAPEGSPREAPETEFTPALEAVAAAPPAVANAEHATIVAIGQQAEAMLAAIEEMAGLPPAEAKVAAAETQAIRDEALDAAALPQPPGLEPGRLAEVLGALLEELTRGR